MPDYQHSRPARPGIAHHLDRARRVVPCVFVSKAVACVLVVRHVAPRQRGGVPCPSAPRAPLSPVVSLPVCRCLCVGSKARSHAAGGAECRAPPRPERSPDWRGLRHERHSASLRALHPTLETGSHRRCHYRDRAGRVVACVLVVSHAATPQAGRSAVSPPRRERAPHWRASRPGKSARSARAPQKRSRWARGVSEFRRCRQPAPRAQPFDGRGGPDLSGVSRGSRCLQS